MQEVQKRWSEDGRLQRTETYSIQQCYKADDHLCEKNKARDEEENIRCESYSKWTNNGLLHWGDQIACYLPKHGPSAKDLQESATGEGQKA